jgi:hypothetical protein
LKAPEHAVFQNFVITATPYSSIPDKLFGTMNTQDSGFWISLLAGALCVCIFVFWILKGGRRSR